MGPSAAPVPWHLWAGTTEDSEFDLESWAGCALCCHGLGTELWAWPSDGPIWPVSGLLRGGYLAALMARRVPLEGWANSLKSKIEPCPYPAHPCHGPGTVGPLGQESLLSNPKSGYFGLKLNFATEKVAEAITFFVGQYTPRPLCASDSVFDSEAFPRGDRLLGPSWGKRPFLG